VSAPGSGSLEGGQFGAVPAVASFEVVDTPFELRGALPDPGTNCVERITTGALDFSGVGTTPPNKLIE